MATITTSDELRLYNRSRILSCLRQSGRQSRTQIGESTGLSAATVTLVTASLIDDGVIKQITPTAAMAPGGNLNAKRGRPQVILELKPEAATTAVLTLLLNQIEVTLYDYAGNQLERQTRRIVTESLSEQSLKKHLFKLLDVALARKDPHRSSLKHIALICQGTVTSDNSGLLWSPITTIRDFDLRAVLQHRYGVGVTVSNDCNTIASALYAEWHSKHISAEEPAPSSLTTPAMAGNNFAAILLSYGIGLGFFHQGSILTGSHSSGTEFGHMLYRADGALCRCGRLGCIEAYASDYAIWRKANRLAADTVPADHIPKEEFSNLIELATQQPGPARDAFSEAGAAIGQGLTNLFTLFDPFPTVLVGTSSIAFTLMEKSLYKNLRHHGTNDSSNYVSVYNNTSESNLIRSGASLQALTYIDREVFGFGEKNLSSYTPASI